MSQEEDGGWKFEEELVQGGFWCIADCVAEGLLSEKIIQCSEWSSSSSSALLTAGVEGGEEVADRFLWVNSTSGGAAGTAGSTVKDIRIERNGGAAASPGKALLKAAIRV